MAKPPEDTAGKAADTTRNATRDEAAPEGPLWVLERRTHRVISRHRFVARMGLAVGLWAALTLIGLTIGMLGYAHFENLSWTDAYVNAAMILSGMGPVQDIKTEAGKLFAGTFAIFSGLFIVIATGFILAPVFHRVLHKFHVDLGKD